LPGDPQETRIDKNLFYVESASRQGFGQIVEGHRVAGK
jgi:hypothetical protein